MSKSSGHKHQTIRQGNELWFIFMCLGTIFLIPPFITIFNSSLLLGGFPLIFIYLFTFWVLLVLSLYLYAASSSKSD